MYKIEKNVPPPPSRGGVYLPILKKMNEGNSIVIKGYGKVQMFRITARRHYYKITTRRIDKNMWRLWLIAKAPNFQKTKR